MRRHLILGTLLYLRIASVVLAQTASGVIRGTVVDPTGAVVTDVHVTLVDDARRQTWEQRSNQNGLFEFRALPFGHYRIEVDHPGFTKALIEDVALQVAQTVSVNVALRVGSVADSIVVHADRGLLEGSDASLSQAIDDKRLLGLPINGRNVMQLVSLSAGVIIGGRASATQRQANYGPGFSVGGQRDNTSVVLIDGLEISGQELNNYPLAIPPLESLAEFRVQTANYSAEFGGNSGAMINVASKRGSNEFHSTAFEFLRNDALDARNPFSSTVDPLTRHQFGLTASGPIFLPGLYNGKDKLFWMFSYEGTRRRQAVTTTAVVPTLEERAGNFSRAPAVIVDPFTKTPFPDNMIPAGRINPVGSELASLYPDPNNADPARNYIGHPAGISDNNVLAARIDYRPRPRDAIWGRFTRNAPFDRGVGQALSPAFPGFDQEQSDHNLQLAAGNAHSFTPTTINELNIGFVQFRRERRSVDAFTRNWIQELGIKGFSPDPLTWAAPSMTPSGYPEIGYSSNNAVFNWVTQSAQLVDNFSAVRARHTLKAGLTIQLKRLATLQWGQPSGTYTFSGQFSAPVPLSATSRYNALADLLLGIPSSYTVQTTPFSPHLWYTNMGYYVQDDWRVTDSLTANVGLRWEYFGRPVERDNRIASFDLTTGQQVFPEQNGYPRSLVDPYYKDFAPRLGLAWRAGTRTTLRGGYGMFYTPDVINTYRQLAFQEPFGEISSLTARPADPRKPVARLHGRGSVDGGYSLDHEQPHWHAARPARWSGAAMDRVRPASRREHDVARSGLSRFQERSPHGRSQLQRNRPVSGSTAEFCARSSIPAAGQRQYLRVTRGRKVRRGAGTARTPPGQRLYRSRLIHVSADVDRSGCQQRRRCGRRWGRTPDDQGYSRQLGSGAIRSAAPFSRELVVRGSVFPEPQGSVGNSRRRLADRGHWDIPGRPISDAVFVWSPVRRVSRQSAR